MKNLFIFQALALTLSACSAGSSNNIFSNGEPVSSTIVSRQVQVSDFSGLTVYLPAKITYTSGSESLSVSAPENVMDELQFNVKDDNLEIKLKNGAPQFRDDLKINISISSDALERLQLYSASSFAAKSLESDKLKCKIYGASKFNVDNITAPDVDFEIGGASNIMIGNMETSSADIDVYGASNVSVGKLIAVDTDVEISGASSSKINDLECNRLTAEISGASKAEFRGIEATVLSCEASGASTLTLSGKAHTAGLEASGASSINARHFSCPNLSKSTYGASSIH